MCLHDYIQVEQGKCFWHNYEMHLQHNQVSSNSVSEDIPTHTKWYHSWHWSHGTILYPCLSGSQHTQYILNEVIIALHNIILVLTEGNTVNSFVCKQERKCDLIFGKSYYISTRSSL